MTSRPSQFTLTSPGRLQLYSIPELLQLPAPEWLIENMIPAGGVVGLYGPSGSKKSFIAIDLALSIACGVPWQGNPVQRGYVLYIGAEGGAGIAKRVAAWLRVHDQQPLNALMACLLEVVYVNDDNNEGMGELLHRIDDEAQIHPALIIIDTLARCFDGDENTQEDMGRFIQGVDKMRTKYGATIMVVHHTNKGGESERGSGAFRGAADTMIAIKADKDSGGIILECTKQKDAEEFAPMELMLQLVPECDSAVIAKAGSIKADIVMGWITIGPQKFSDLKARTEEEGSHVSLATLKRKLRELQDSGRIVKDSAGFYTAA